MKICVENKCTACYACVNACPTRCICMQENEYGELHPIVNEVDCKHCNACVKSCPNNINVEYRYPIKCLASWITDNKKRKICASGGIGTIISEYVIRNKQGIVFGTRYTEDMTPITISGTTLNDIEAFKGSKYVQSIVGNSFKQIKSYLKDNRFVLYIGTPCQIAGLYAYLKKDYVNLVTIDLICHGVCPTRYFKEEVQFLKNKNSISELSDVRFRGNDGNNFRLTLWNNGKCLYKSRHSYYLSGFLLGVSMRENCYTCNYARPERISDITIGDFIGLGKTIPFNYPKSNVSSVFLNTNKAIEFYDAVSSEMHILKNVERDYNERLEYGPSLRYPFERHELNSVFRSNYLMFGYTQGIRETLKGIVRKNRIKGIINYWTYIYRVPRKICQLIANKVETIK